MEEINTKIKKLNDNGFATIFFVTGNNSTGKTRIVKELLKDLNFYQSINLGIISKLLRFFRPDIPASQLENFNHNEATSIFKDAIDFMIDSYTKTGVNAIFDGVQADTNHLSKNNNVLGGIILSVDEVNIFKRGEFPETHFKRSIREHGLKSISYEENEKFKVINNNGSLLETINDTKKHLTKLLDDKLKEYES